MSFIDLLANDVWSEQDIINRTEAIIRSEFSMQSETILNRKLLGEITGSYTMNNDEKAELIKYKTVVMKAQEAAVEARQDMALLNQVLAFEKIAKRLNQPIPEQIIVDQEITNQAEIDAHWAERESIQAELDAMPADIRTLYDLRNPAPVLPKPEIPEAVFPPLQVPEVNHSVE